jgi:hypothetical protein
MQGQMVASSPSTSEPPVGMSDEEELRRSGFDFDGLGEDYNPAQAEEARLLFNEL